MNRLSTIPCVLALFVVNVMASTLDPFPKFEELTPPVLMKSDTKITVSPDGHLLADGKPRYLEGVLYYEGVTQEVGIPTYGYPAELKWLYESTQNYQDLQRIGFDAVGTGAPNWWIDKYRPKKDYIRLGYDDAMHRRFLESGLPVYVDYTCAGWHHGALKYQEGELPSKEAFPVPGTDNNHWVPYSLTTPEGRQLWLEMWTYGVRYFQELGVKPFVYELFNEPDYNDWSDFNRKLFVERMKKKYNNDLAALNRAWRTEYADFAAIGDFKRQTEHPALCVEWIKFMEDAFTDICAAGVQEMRKIDLRPEAGFCVQPLFWRNSNINMYTVNRHMNMVSSSTGGGDLMQAHFLRSIADGKPISDGETYMGKTRESFRDKIILQFARGFNASYIFKWSRRSNAPQWRTPEPEGEKQLAETFPYMMLNPFAVPTEALLGLMDAKKDIVAVSDLFAPRNRGVEREVAVLYSQPSHRLGRAAGQLCSNLLISYGEALEYAQIPIDVILEEQLAEGRLRRYRILVAAGVDAIYPETAARLEDWVKAGGTLILGQEALQSDEYGFSRNPSAFPGITVGKEQTGERGKLRFNAVEAEAAPYKTTIPDGSWKPLAALENSPVLFEKRFGKGKVLFLNAKLPADSLGDLLTAMLANENVTPSCKLTGLESGQRAHSVEVTKAVRDGFTGYILINQGLAPRLVRFVPPEDVPFADVSRRALLERNDGGYLLLLRPEHAVILLGGERAKLEAHLGKLKNLSFAEQQAEGKAAQEAFRAANAGVRQAFDVDLNRIRTVDLRRYANRDFTDRVAGDGKGGWTDQGANSLHGVPWGIQNCNGVPFDLIRTDQNDERTCIVLGSRSAQELPLKVEGIRVDSKAKNLFFLHTAAWLNGKQGTTGFRYQVNYADGGTVDIPIREGIEVADWYWPLANTRDQKCVPGFINSEKRGIFVWKWENPHPEKTIATIDIVSENTALIPIIAGISVELSGGNQDATILPLLPPERRDIRANGWNKAGIRLEDGNQVAIDFTEATPWASVYIRLPEAVQIPEQFADAELQFELAAEGAPPPMQIKLGKEGAFRPFHSNIGEAEADGWRPVALSLDSIMKDIHAPFSEISIQLIEKGEPRKKLQLRNLRLLLKAKRDPLAPQRLKSDAWGGLAMAVSGDRLEFKLSDKSTNWCGVNLQPSAPVTIPAGATQLRFDVNGGVDQWGRREQGGAPFQVALRTLDVKGAKVKSQYVTPEIQVDSDPSSWQTVSIPLARLISSDSAMVEMLSFQFKMLPAERCGIQIRNLCFE